MKIDNEDEFKHSFYDKKIDSRLLASSTEGKEQWWQRTFLISQKGLPRSAPKRAKPLLTMRWWQVNTRPSVVPFATSHIDRTLQFIQDHRLKTEWQSRCHPLRLILDLSNPKLNLDFLNLNSATSYLLTGGPILHSKCFDDIPKIIFPTCINLLTLIASFHCLTIKWH